MYTFVILIVLIAKSIALTCPPSEILQPCRCQDDRIVCEGEAVTDIAPVFEKMKTSSIKFDQNGWFTINNTKVTKIPENAIKDFTFKRIEIGENPELQRIDHNTFAETNLITTQLWIYANPKLSSPDNSIYELASKFINLEGGIISNNNISEVPSKAFKPIIGHQNHLKYMEIGGGTIKSIGDSPFYYLNTLNELLIDYTTIPIFPEKLLVFEKPSDEKFKLILRKNKFTNSNDISKNSFSFLCRRPA